MWGGRTREGTQYLASVAVMWTELIKLLVCMVAQMVECARSAGQRGLPFKDEMVHQAEEILGRSWPMLVPAALFVMQQARFFLHALTHYTHSANLISHVLNPYVLGSQVCTAHLHRKNRI